MRNYFVKSEILSNVERYNNQEKELLSESMMMDGLSQMQKQVELEQVRTKRNIETLKLQDAK